MSDTLRHTRDVTTAVRRREYDRLRYVRRNRLRASVLAYTDVTPDYQAELRLSATRCPLCRRRMTDDQGDFDRRKELDHIVPLALGGTHTIGNLRIICGACNRRRPADGSDLGGLQLGLWQADLEAAALFVGAEDRKRQRLISRLEREVRAVEAQLRECQRDIRAHDAALAYIDFGAWSAVARVTGYRDGSAARQAVEQRTDYLDADGARHDRNRWRERVGRLAWLPGADTRMRAGVLP